MQPREMWELFTQVGFGQKPQIDFPGAVTGRLRPYKTWRPIEQATMSYGYGLSASLFQLARAYTRVRARRRADPACRCCRTATSPPAGMRVLSPETARAVREMLQHGRRPGRHRAEGAGDRLLGRRQDRHRVQAGRQGLREEQVPLLVRRHGADRQPAHRRRGDGRRAQRRQVLRRRRGRAGVQRGRAADAAHAGRAARHRGASRRSSPTASPAEEESF